jgi:SAM-dependent methyltransferase
VSYRLADYVAMVADADRTGAYARALQRLVRPDSVVLDLGAGFGYFAVLAATLGARHVYAVEPNDAIALGPELARANGVADRVTFVRGDSREAALPERANLLVEDLRGVLPLHGERIPLLVDARERLLTADARVVAVRDRLHAAPARARVDWEADRMALAEPAFGLDLTVIARRMADQWRHGRVDPADLLCDGASLGELDLASVTSANFDGTAEWTMPSEARVDGVAVWFEAELAEGETFTTAPGRRQSAHGAAFFPLRAPVALRRGDALQFHLAAFLVGVDYTWAWDSRWRAGTADEWTAGASQSSLLEALPLERSIASLSATDRARPSASG